MGKAGSILICAKHKPSFSNRANLQIKLNFKKSLMSKKQALVGSIGFLAEKTWLLYNLDQTKNLNRILFRFKKKSKKYSINYLNT